MNTALNRTVVALLTNKSGGNLNYGDVVIGDTSNAQGFKTTTTAGYSATEVGVILEPNGIANNATGLIATAGWVPRINLNTAATAWQLIKTHTVAGQGTPHSSPQVEGDFAVALDASATPSAILFGSPNGPTSGSSLTLAGVSGDIQTNNGAGNLGSITPGSGIATWLATPSSANLRAALTDESGTGAAVFATSPTLVTPVLGTPASGDATNLTNIPVNQAKSGSVLPGANGGGLVLLETHAASGAASVEFTGFSSTYQNYIVTAENIIAATDGANLFLTFADAGGYFATNYSYVQFYRGTTTAQGTNVSAAATSILVWGGVDNTLPINLYCKVLASQQSANNVIFMAEESGFSSAAEFFTQFITGQHALTSPVTKMKFAMSAGNINGTFRLYGIAD